MVALGGGMVRLGDGSMVGLGDSNVVGLGWWWYYVAMVLWLG